MKKQKKQSKNQKSFIIAACIIGTLLVIAIALMIAVLVRQNNPDQSYNKKPTETTIDEIDKTPANATTEPTTSTYISADRAVDIALENIGATRGAVRDLDVELDYEFGQKVYEVTFDYNQYEYDYYINPESGDIIKSFKEIDY